MAEEPKVSKKVSKNGTITLFLGKRDFTDHVTSVEPIDGVVHVDPKDLNGRKVWISLACAFRYGSDDLDVIGLSFRKDIWFKYYQLYPPADHKPTLSPMHEILVKKAGDIACPFTFQLPPNLPCSVNLQPGPGDKGKSCGVDFEVKAYVANHGDNPDEHISKKDRARFIIRKMQYGEQKPGPGPKAEVCRNFMMSDKPVHLEISLEKELYYHGEAIPVHIKINNETTKTVSKIKMFVEQQTDVVLYSADKYTKPVFTQEFSETVEANGTFEKTLTFTPKLSENQEKRGLALDSGLKEADVSLASSTMLGAGAETLGILVSYKVKVNLIASSGGLLGGLTASDITAEVPLILMHPKPTK